MELKYAITTCHFRPITVPWSPQTTMPSPYNIRDKTVPAHFCHIVKKKSTVKSRGQDLGSEFIQHLPTKSPADEHSGKSASIPVKRASTCSTINRHHFAPTTHTKPYLGLYDPDSVINTIAGSSAHSIPKNRLLHCGGGIVYPSPEVGQTPLTENPTLKIDWGQTRFRAPENSKPNKLPSPLHQPYEEGPSRPPIHTRPVLHRSLSSPYPDPRLPRFDNPRRVQSAVVQMKPTEVLNAIPLRSSAGPLSFPQLSSYDKEGSPHKTILPKFRPADLSLSSPERRPTDRRVPEGFVQPLKKRAYHAPEEVVELPKPPKEARLWVKTNLCDRLPSSIDGASYPRMSFSNPLEIRIEVTQNSAPKVIFEKPVQIQSLMRRPSEHREFAPMVKIPIPVSKHFLSKDKPRDLSVRTLCADQKATICKERAEKLRSTLLSVMHVLLGPTRMHSLGYPKNSTDEMLIEVLHKADLAPKRGISYTCLRENTKLFLSLLVSDKKEVEKRGWERLDPEEVLEEIYIKDVLPHLESVSKMEPRIERC